MIKSKFYKYKQTLYKKILNTIYFKIRIYLKYK